MKRFELLKELPGFPAGTVLCAKGNKGSAVQKLYTESGDILSGYELHDSLIYVGAGVGAGPISNWLRELPDDEHRRWRASRGDEYFYLISSGMVDSDKEFELLGDDLRYAMGNYFKTEEEAQAYADYLKALVVVREDAKGFVPDWKDEHQSKYYVCYLHEREGLCLFDDVIRRHADNGVFGLPYFETEEDARASIEKHEKEWKTIFGVKDKEDDE